MSLAALTWQAHKELLLIDKHPWWRPGLKFSEGLSGAIERAFYGRVPVRAAQAVYWPYLGLWPGLVVELYQHGAKE